MVIMTWVDWKQAFDQNEPTKNAQKFIKLGLQPSLVPILIDFMSKRKKTSKI